MDLGQGTVTHSFLGKPDFLHLLIGRDLSSKVGTIMVNENKASLDLRSPYTVILVTCSLSEGYKMTEKSNEDLGRGEILLIGLMDANISLECGQKPDALDWPHTGHELLLSS